MIEQGDLLLIPFPFSDQSGRKVRPVIVISNNEFNANSDDIIVVGVTSTFSRDKYTLSLTNKDLEAGRLISSCYVKVENILKIGKGLIIKRIGKINKSKLKSIISTLNEILT